MNPFTPGKNCDGWFSASDLLWQVDHVIDIFEGNTGGWAQGLFMFDNASSHQKQADNSLSARRMVKGAWFTYFLLSSSHSFQPQRTAGSTIQVANACAMVCFQLAPRNYFTSWMITLPCPGGLRAWKSSFVSGDCGQNNGHWLHIVKGLTPLCLTWTAFEGDGLMYLRSRFHQRYEPTR